MNRHDIFKVVRSNRMSKSEAQKEMCMVVAELYEYAGADLLSELKLILAGHKGTDTTFKELISYYKRADKDHKASINSMVKWSVEAMIHSR